MTLEISILKDNWFKYKEVAKKVIAVQRKKGEFGNYEAEVIDVDQNKSTKYLTEGLSEDLLDKFFTGEQIIIPFDFSPDPSEDYYVKASWVLSDNPKGSKTLYDIRFTHKFELNTYEKKESWSLNNLSSEDPDKDNNYLLDTYPSIEIPSVSTSDATSITHNSAVIGGVVIEDGGGEITETGAFIGTSTDPVNDGDFFFLEFDDPQFSTTITGLTPNTKYYYVAMAENAVGMSIGKIKSFNTLLDGSAPVADFFVEESTLFVGEEVEFTDLSTNSPTGWSWNFGDGGSSTDQNPKYTYSIAGTYSVSLTASNNYGADTITQSISVTESSSGGDDILFNPDLTYGTMSDIDGNTYKTIIIGSQTWMAENLKVTHYANGSAIPYVETNSDWDALGYDDKAYCWYDNSTANRDIYGGLYTWSAAKNGEASSDANPSGVQGVCPSGWHLPSESEWRVLEMYLGMSQSDVEIYGMRGTDQGGKLKEVDNTHWSTPNLGATNSSGFTALPGGHRSNSGIFYNLYNHTAFYSSTEKSKYDSWSRVIKHNSAGVLRGISNGRQGTSIRCIKD